MVSPTAYGEYLRFFLFVQVANDDMWMIYEHTGFAENHPVGLTFRVFVRHIVKGT